MTIREASSRFKTFEIAFRANNACHHTEALEQFTDKHPDTKSSLARWYALMRKGRFSNFVQLREVFPQADQVGKFTVFNVAGTELD